MTGNLRRSCAPKLPRPEPRHFAPPNPPAGPSNDIPAAPIRFIKLREVIDRVSLSSTEIYRQMQNGRFPRPIRLSQARVAWLECDIDAWQQKVIARQK